MVQFLSIYFFSWISSILGGFFKGFRFFVSLCTYGRTQLYFNQQYCGYTTTVGTTIYFGLICWSSSGFTVTCLATIQHVWAILWVCVWGSGGGGRDLVFTSVIEIQLCSTLFIIHNKICYWIKTTGIMHLIVKLQVSNISEEKLITICTSCFNICTLYFQLFVFSELTVIVFLNRINKFVIVVDILWVFFMQLHDLWTSEDHKKYQIICFRHSTT